MSSWSTSDYILHKRNKLYAMSKREREREREREGGREGGREGRERGERGKDKLIIGRRLHDCRKILNDGNIIISNTGFINN